MNGPTYGGGNVRSMSLEQIEEELARSERTLSSLRDALSRSHAQTSADSAALHQMGIRTKEIMNRPKTWRGGSKRSDAGELDALRAEIRTKSESVTRTQEDMKAKSVEARELAKRVQALSTRRAELLNAANQ
jgi:chromosome segregation ATPase